VAGDRKNSALIQWHSRGYLIDGRGLCRHRYLTAGGRSLERSLGVRNGVRTLEIAMADKSDTSMRWRPFSSLAQTLLFVFHNR
jgi:hypothetical protein